MLITKARFLMPFLQRFLIAGFRPSVEVESAVTAFMSLLQTPFVV